MAKTIKVDKDLCIGCGACAGICPNIFEIDDEGKAAAIVAEVSDDDAAAADEAAGGCPVGAIVIE